MPEIDDLDVERFWTYVEPWDGCWLWIGTVSKGYGVFVAGRHAYGAHRFAWVIEGNELAPGDEVHHRCGHKLCVKPWHLVAMTRDEHYAEHRRLRHARRMALAEMRRNP